MVLRGGSSKGAFFLADDLPADPDERDDLLLRIMGSPDDRQIDGIGGAHPLTSKVAVVSADPEQPGTIRYLFLQVMVGQAVVSAAQNCGNILAGVGPFALERGLLDGAGAGSQLRVPILMENTGSMAWATFPVAGRAPAYHGDTSISGVPGSAAPIRLDFDGLAGGTCGSLLPTGRLVDEIDGVPVTCVDNGMPVVVMAGADLGVAGTETPTELEADDELRARLERIRLEAGPLMGLGDVESSSVPKLTMVGPPGQGGHLSTRTFIPHRCHDAIGVLGAVSVATAALLPGTPAHQVLVGSPGLSGEGPGEVLVLEHPTGTFDATVTVDPSTDPPTVERAGIIRTARKLMDGTVFPRPHR